MNLLKIAATVAAVGVANGCAGTDEIAVRRALAETRTAPQVGRPSTESKRTAGRVSDRESSASQPDEAEGSLAEYLAGAVRRNSGLQATFERWRASVHRISRARRLPEPRVHFAYYVQSVETRVGPQQARLGLEQSFPWPTRLTAGADAAAALARALQRRFEAQALTVVREVTTAYWDLWQVRSARRLHLEHLDVVANLSKSVNARVATGQTTLAELQQIDLQAARVKDIVFDLDESEHAAEARLRSSLGWPEEAPEKMKTPDEPPEPMLPALSLSELRESLSRHPRVMGLAHEVDASEATARAETAQRLPSFTLRADWILTGESGLPGVEHSGQDGIIVGAGIRVPLWQDSYSHDIEAARAEARARNFERTYLLERSRAALVATLAQLRNAARRTELYQHTLVPQAETAYASVLGAYTVGRGAVAETLLLQRDLLELRIELERARADHARAWGRLQELVGRDIKRKPAS